MQKPLSLAVAAFVAVVANARDLYLLIGQSNMAGRGAVTEATRLSSERVWKFTRDGQWAAATEPIHFDRKTVGAGPGLAFARTLADADPLVEIGLIPCAEGGSPLARWQPGRDLYSNAVARTRAACATGGRLRGILWHQGEADSWKRADAETYATRITNMVTRLRADLGARYVPFIAGEVGAHYAVSIEGRGGTSFVARVNVEMKRAVAALPAAGWVSAAGLTPGPDGIHFTTESAYELGRRYAAEIRRWQSVPDQTLEGVDYGGTAADWKPPFTARGFNLQGMRRAGPRVGFREEHFRWMRDWGFNFVRLPLDYRCWVEGRTSANRERIDERGLRPLDEGIGFARKHGLVPMICLHRIPGEYCVRTRDPEPGNIYTDPDCLRAAARHWSLLAERYRAVPQGELIFNLLNEPSRDMGTLDQYEYVCRVLIAAIRRADPKRFVVADGWATATCPLPGLYAVPGVGQATRGYFPAEFSHFGVDVGGAPQDDRPPAFAPTWPPRRGVPDGRLGGSRWKDWHAPFTLADAPAGEYALGLATVSGPVRIAVRADGEAVATFALEPKPDDPDWSRIGKYRNQGPWRGAYRKALAFKLARAAAVLSIQVTDGDWAMPRVLVVKDGEREAWLAFGGNMKTMRNVAWDRRFAGWTAEEPMPARGERGNNRMVELTNNRMKRVGEDFNTEAQRHRVENDAGMEAIAAGFIGNWREPIAKGVWCLVGEFGCANHVAHTDALRFIESNLKLYRAMGLGWCAWGFSGSRFGILNSFRADVAYEDWHGEKLDRAMLELLRRKTWEEEKR